jgi:hypothetical protein
MRQPTWGPIVQQRVRCFLEALLSCADGLYAHQDFLYRWEDADRPKLAIATNRRCLQRISNLGQNQIYEAIKTLKTLEILEDNRTQTQGTEEWHFTLKLWSHNLPNNLSKFEGEWDKKRPRKSRSQVDRSVKSIAPSCSQERSLFLTVSLGYGNCLPKILPHRLT